MIHNIRVRKIKGQNGGITAPRKGDAGYDLYASEDITIHPGETQKVPIGAMIGLPYGYVGLIKDRSSIALAGVHVLAGVIDAAYRGEIQIIMHNHGQTAFEVAVNDKIAQMIVIPAYTKERTDVDELEDTERGSNGFGSTGRRNDSEGAQ